MRRWQRPTVQTFDCPAAVTDLPDNIYEPKGTNIMDNNRDDIIRLRAENDRLRRDLRAMAAAVVQLCAEHGVEVPEPVR